ncbi:MAG: tRNA (N6-threonylcarbamoyladenosine(37)-N6)-methyltransferase TrmO [Candidatus Bathyarchaeota archaeon]|nr:MAG: tRNA (N6-threonylcarbamoyladenosine(37)-N6)-methyltransferase TrmO [Candidatus Bathyarchaeota archaeon]
MISFEKFNTYIVTRILKKRRDNFMLPDLGIVLKSIGVVRTQAVGDEVKDKNRFSQIIIHDKFAEALDGINEFSHLFVLFWLNKVSNEESLLKVHPRGRKDLPLLGVFATRTMYRPNPIGLTLVELAGVEGNVLTVRGLDAFDGTPILDIKPFDNWDTTKDARVPRWWIKLENEKTHPP